MPRTLWLAWLAMLPAAACQEDPELEWLLLNLARDASAFRQAAPRLTAEETLLQQARPEGRRGPRIGRQQAPPMQTRRLVSEFGFGFLQQAPGALREFRLAVEADGRRLRDPEPARTELIAALGSGDDQTRRRMAQDFEKLCLPGLATDYGQALLLFSRARQQGLRFLVSGQTPRGPDGGLIVEFAEKNAPRSGARPLRGRIWFRDTDGMAFRITLVTERDSPQGVLADEGAVDYSRGPNGAPVPAAVLHRQLAGQEVVAENRFRYADVRLSPAQAPAPPK